MERCQLGIIRRRKRIHRPSASMRKRVPGAWRIALSTFALVVVAVSDGDTSPALSASSPPSLGGKRYVIICWQPVEWPINTTVVLPG